MANMVFTQGKRKLLDRSLAGTINWLTASVKVMLVTSSYAPAASDEFVSGGTGNATANELNVTNYTGGFGGTGRKLLANKTISVQSTNIKFDADDVVWTGLGNGLNATIGGAVLIVEVTNDTLSHLIHFLDTNNLTTNSGDVTLSFHATDGILLW